jgi:hypothetical protein
MEFDGYFIPCTITHFNHYGAISFSINSFIVILGEGWIMGSILGLGGWLLRGLPHLDGHIHLFVNVVILGHPLVYSW